MKILKNPEKKILKPRQKQKNVGNTHELRTFVKDLEDVLFGIRHAKKLDPIPEESEELDIEAEMPETEEEEEEEKEEEEEEEEGQGTSPSRAKQAQKSFEKI